MYHYIRIYGYMAAPILDHMTALSDPTRCRMLLLLERHELTVSELCSVLQMPQSTVSRHLKTLADDGWVTSRRDGTSRFYSMPVDDLDAGGAHGCGRSSREQVTSTRGARAGRTAAAQRAEPASREVAGVFRVRGWRVGPASRGAVRRRVLSVGGARPHRSDARRRRPRLWHGAAHGSCGAVRQPRDIG